MEAYSLIIAFICMHTFTTVDIGPELKKYFEFGYRINFKCEGMLLHSIGRFHVATKFISPAMDDTKISSITYDMDCTYFNVQLDGRIHAIKHSRYEKCLYKTVPYLYFYKKKVNYYNKTLHNVLKKNTHHSFIFSQSKEN